jgi:WD40 repeat protein
MNGYVASCSSDKIINIWNPNTGESIQKYKKHTDLVYGLDQIDEDTLVSGSVDMTIHLWKISEGQTFRKIDVGDSVFSIKSISNGLIACGTTRNISIYEHSTGNLVNILIGHSNYVWSIELLNERFMASGSSDYKVIVWDLYSNSIKYELSQHKNVVRCVKRLSSSLMASGDSSGLIIIWNWLNGSLVHKLTGHTSSVSTLDLYDDQTLISGSEDKTIKLWNITNGQLIKTIITDIYIKDLVMLKRGKWKYFNKSVQFLNLFLNIRKRE